MSLQELFVHDRTAIIIRLASESIGMGSWSRWRYGDFLDGFLQHLGFKVVQPKNPSLQRIIDAAPDLIVFDWTFDTESKNERLVRRIRDCSTTADMPILVSTYTEAVESGWAVRESALNRVGAVRKLALLRIPCVPDAVLAALKQIGFTDLKTRALKSISAHFGSAMTGSSEHVVDGVHWYPAEIVQRICERVPLVVRQLQQRYDGRPALGVADEYDVQDVLHALLRLFFDDIRSEEYTPSYAGMSSRMDFLLKNESIVIEVKMVRKGLGAKEIGAQLIIDIAHYRAHPGCKKLFCLVYDSDHYIKNARGLEKDLSSADAALDVTVIVTPKGE